MPPKLSSINQEIIRCEDCPRLRDYGREVARVKRRAYLKDTYWGKPVTGFGDPEARLLIMGLAPAAHGAHRTGRIFTGDRSGEWLYRALHKQGFANQPTSTHADDGLKLQDCYITCVVKCAPPGNKPLPEEVHACSRHVERELDVFSPRVRVWLALGQIGLQGLWPHLQRLDPSLKGRPKFGHAAEYPLGRLGTLLLSYHPSQQNTFTGRLTEPMFDRVFARARKLIS